MVLAGARIYNDGVGIGHEAEEKIQQIVNAIKAISPSSDVSMRLLKNGHVYEGLLWGKANDLPIGVYKRGISMTQVLENIYKRVKKDCVKALKSTCGRRRDRHVPHPVELAMAG
jgi:hypothetical protein